MKLNSTYESLVKGIKHTEDRQWIRDALKNALSHLKFTEDIPEIASEGLGEGMTKEYLYGEALKDFTSVLNTIKEYLILQAKRDGELIPNPQLSSTFVDDIQTLVEKVWCRYQTVILRNTEEYGGRDYQKEYERINNSRGWDAKEREIYLLRKDILKAVINQDEPFNELSEIEKDFLLKETIIWSDLDRNYYGCSPFSYRNIEDGVPYIDTYRNNQKTTQKELSNV